MRAVGGTRSRMTASPRSYDLLLHRLISDFSTELSPVHQPVLHNLSTGLSTGWAAHDGCLAKVKTPARRLDYNSSAVNVNL